MTHEEFLAYIADEAIKRCADSVPAHRLVYGIGGVGYRGITVYSSWKNGHENPIPLVEVCAAYEEGPWQVAGTLLHELGHVLAGHTAAHGPQWKKACESLGLKSIRAAGTVYHPARFRKDIRELVYTIIPKLSDGNPDFGLTGKGLTIATPPKPKPCPMGIGTRGGKSRGKGSGSRLLKAMCPMCGYTIRITRKWANKGLPICPCDRETELILV